MPPDVKLRALTSITRYLVAALGLLFPLLASSGSGCLLQEQLAAATVVNGVRVLLLQEFCGLSSSPATYAEPLFITGSGSQHAVDLNFQTGAMRVNGA